MSGDTTDETRNDRKALGMGHWIVLCYALWELGL